MNDKQVVQVKPFTIAALADAAESQNTAFGCPPVDCVLHKITFDNGSDLRLTLKPDQQTTMVDSYGCKNGDRALILNLPVRANQAMDVKVLNKTGGAYTGALNFIFVRR